MILAGRPAKILLIDTNVYFSKRLSDALKREGFEVNCSTQPAFALTTIEYDPPTAIVCSTTMREMGALDIARMVRADAKNSTLPVIALGDGSQRALMEAFQAGCDDYIDRTRPPAVIATHVRNIIISKAEGFHPTQMLPQADTSLSGSLTHHDLPGVMQMLGHAHQTGALHINSGHTDALLFFDAGEITHAECGALFGDEAVIHILQNCMRNNSGVYKFLYGSSSAKHTVLRSATDLMLDAMREMDESAHQSQQDERSIAGQSGQDSPFTPLIGLAGESLESAAIAAAIADFAANAQKPGSGPPPSEQVLSVPAPSEPSESPALLEAKPSETRYVFAAPAPGDPPAGRASESLAEPEDLDRAAANSRSSAEPSFANYSIVPYAGNEMEDIT
jgi:CheY-like chemotaxis protein